MSGLQGYAAAAAWIRQRLLTGWTIDDELRTPIAWDNMPFSPPEPAEPYIRPTIRHDVAETASIGAPTSVQHRFPGTLIIEVLTPQMTHTAANEALCDLLEALFRHVSDSGIRFYTPYTLRTGEAQDQGESAGGWFKQDVMCPFVRDTIFT